jgi:hypothetical protein
MAILVKTNGEIEYVSPQNDSDFSLNELKNFVGGYIEILPLGKELMVINEEGKLLGLPYNENATARLQSQYGANSDYIVGNALICSAKQIK